MLPGKQVDWEVEGGVYDHKELHGGRDEHGPEGGAVHAAVSTCQDAPDVRRLVDAGDQSEAWSMLLLCCNGVMWVACPGPRDRPLKILISSGDARQILINLGLICIFACYMGFLEILNKIRDVM